MTSPRFSVLLPVYNGAAYLREAIDSVLGQTFEDFELLVWDDASSDESAAIIASFGDERVRAHRSERNRGLFPTLNLAARASRGELVRLLGQDDVLKPGCLAREDLFWQEQPDLGMSYCQVDVIDENGELVAGPKDDETPTRVSPALASQISFYHGSMPGNISPVVLSRKILFEVGLFREDLRLAGDFELWTRICERHVTGFLREPLLYLRRHSGQLSRSREAYPQFMRETQEVVERLIARLPAELQRYARRYERWNRHVLYAHHMIRCLVLGRFREARDTMRILRSTGSVLGASLRWLVSANRRLYGPEPRYSHGDSGDAQGPVREARRRRVPSS